MPLSRHYDNCGSGLRLEFANAQQGNQSTKKGILSRSLMVCQRLVGFRSSAGPTFRCVARRRLVWTALAGSIAGPRVKAATAASSEAAPTPF